VPLQWAPGPGVFAHLRGHLREAYGPALGLVKRPLFLLAFARAVVRVGTMDITVEIGGGAYRTTVDAYTAECLAKKEGAKAKRDGVHFHDNPYRKGPPADTDWLYSAWEYGYVHGDGPDALGRVRDAS